MKQFAQCTQCQQWYVYTATSTVEIYHHDQLHCRTTWCVGCIAAAEQRSRPAPPPSAAPVPLACPAVNDERTLSETFQQFLAEHLRLMERALHDDEEVLIPDVQDFLERSGRCQGQLESPEQQQRLAGHMHYWETFLKTLATHKR